MESPLLKYVTLILVIAFGLSCRSRRDSSTGSQVQSSAATMASDDTLIDCGTSFRMDVVGDKIQAQFSVPGSPAQTFTGHLIQMEKEAPKRDPGQAGDPFWVIRMESGDGNAAPSFLDV